MAAELITLPFRPTINLKGGLESGAKLYVYLTGTTTPVSVYSDATLLTPLTNPVIADAFGVFPDVYYNDTLTVRIIIQQANGTTLSDTDPYVSDPASAEAAADLANSYAQIAQSLSGKLYANTTLGLADTANTEEFAVDNGDGTAGIYLNNAGSAVLQRTIIISPTASGSSDLLGFIQSGTGAATRTIQDKLRETITPEDFGAIGNGTADDTTALNNAIASLTNGGIVLGAAGAVYKTSGEIVLLDNVHFDMNGSKIAANLASGNTAGVSMRSGSTIENGEIEVISTGTPGTQSAIHAPIRLGSIYGGAGTVASPTAGAIVSGITIRNMTVHSNKQVDIGGGNLVGAAGIAVYGGVSEFVIENITVPNNTRMAGGVMLDWGYLGTLSSTATQAAQDANKTAFNAGTAYTLHPHNGVIRNIKIGDLSAAVLGTDGGSYGVRLSGVYNVRVENVEITTATNAAIRHTAGDLGFEFAPANQKQFACRGVVFSGVSVKELEGGYLVLSDSYADNIGTAEGLGYTPLLDPRYVSDIVFENVTGKGPNSASSQYGIRFQDQIGAHVIGGSATGCKQGINVDQYCGHIVIDGFRAYGNREDGINIHHGTNAPHDITVRDCICESNGTNTSGYATSAGLYIGGSKRVTVERGAYGVEGANDATQQIGIRVVSGAIDTVIRDPYLRSGRSADGFGMIILSSTAYNEFGYLTGARFDTTYLNTTYGGLDCVPFGQTLYPGGGGAVLTEYTTNSANTLVGLVVVQGDRIWFGDSASAAAPGRVAVSSGTIGTNSGVDDVNTLTKTMAVLA